MAPVTTSPDRLRQEAEDLAADMVELRRALHRRPELGLQNPGTQQRVLEAIEPLDLDVTTGEALTSVVATLVGGRPGPTILLRADTDALPMTEDTLWDHRSEVDGAAHLCGHDAHVAMLVGAARLLAARRDDLAGSVQLMFQPGEEGPGGAPLMLSEGVLRPRNAEPVSAAFALHVSPNVPTGIVAGRPGALMAATDDFRVVVRGRGGHASTPHFGNDPVPVAAEMIGALQTMVTRRINAFDPAVVTVAHLTAGTTTNVIPDQAVLEGTIRTVSESTRAGVRAGFERICRGIAAAHECEVDVHLRAGYPVTVNDAGFTELAAGVVRSTFGDDAYFELPTPIMGAEDFSFVLGEVPGAMLFLGACPADIDDFLAAPSCHSNLMRIDERALPLGAALHAAVALRYLGER